MYPLFFLLSPAWLQTPKRGLKLPLSIPAIRKYHGQDPAPDRRYNAIRSHLPAGPGNGSPHNSDTSRSRSTSSRPSAAVKFIKVIDSFHVSAVIHGSEFRFHMNPIVLHLPQQNIIDRLPLVKHNGSRSVNNAVGGNQGFLPFCQISHVVQDRGTFHQQRTGKLTVLIDCCICGSTGSGIPSGTGSV